MPRLRAIQVPAMAVAAGAVALTGVTYAAGSTKAVTTACASHHGGTLYIAKHCRHGDKRVQLAKAGRRGKPGSPAGFPTTLPSKHSLTGTWAIDGVSEAVGDSGASAVSFALPLAKPPTPHFIILGGDDPEGCTGSPTHPAALPGNLCIYLDVDSGVAGIVDYADPTTGVQADTVPVFGFEMVNSASGSGEYRLSGSWAVTAP